MNAVEIALDNLVRVSKLRMERGIGPECGRRSYENAAKSALALRSGQNVMRFSWRQHQC